MGGGSKEKGSEIRNKIGLQKNVLLFDTYS